MTEITTVEDGDDAGSDVATRNSATDANMNTKQRPDVVHAVAKATKDDCRKDADIIAPVRVRTRCCQNNNTSEEHKHTQNTCLCNGESQTSKAQQTTEFVPRIKWPDFIGILALHLGSLVGFVLMFTSAKVYTSLWALTLIYTTGFGITAGAHRLWSHRAYKAKWPLKLLLIFLFTITGQRDVYTWALDHRVHHKYSETDSDPHNAKRGFWFAHVGWLFLTSHPDVVQRRLDVDMSDLVADPIVMWQKKYYLPLYFLLVIILPTWIPWYYWNENIIIAFLIGFALRYCATLNIAFFVNSAAHMWGNRPYDKFISPVENIAVSIAALGEGWHNYHHVFPWDYKTSELGAYTYNISTGFIDFFARIGWAYDRKKVSPEMIARRAAKSGDGSHGSAVWGYGDRDILIDDLKELEQMKE